MRVNNSQGQTQPCPKCGGLGRETGEFRASGGGLSAFFNFATARFTYVSCADCGYTEFYSAKLSTASRIIDFLGGGN